MLTLPLPVRCRIPGARRHGGDVISRHVGGGFAEGPVVMLIQRAVRFGAEMSQPAVTMQSAALPYRLDRGDGAEVLLITTQSAGRWAIPKGGIADGLGGATAVGVYRALQRGAGGGHRVVEVWVYPLRVERCLAAWPEQGGRQVRWFAAAKAAALVDEPVVAALCRKLAKGDIPG